MAMVIESEIWRPSPWLYTFLVISCGAAIYGRFHVIYKRSRTVPQNLESSSNSFMCLPLPFLSFQRSFLCIYLLASVAEALQAVYGESFYQQYGIGREDMALLFAFGYLVSLFVGTFLGIASDFIGRKKACIVFCILHLIGCLARLFSKYHSLLMGTSSISLASSLFSCTFETWMTTEHEKLGFRQDWLSDTFWTMSFGAAASSLGSAALANALVNWKGPHGMALPSAAAAVVAVVCAILITKGWGENMATTKIKTRKIVLSLAYLMADKRILLLAWVQTCFDFAVFVFWFLWTPTIVLACSADLPWSLVGFPSRSIQAKLSSLNSSPLFSAIQLNCGSVLSVGMELDWIFAFYNVLFWKQRLMENSQNISLGLLKWAAELQKYGMGAGMVLGQPGVCPGFSLSKSTRNLHKKQKNLVLKLEKL